MRDSNSRHLRCKRSALPTELITRGGACSQTGARVQEGRCISCIEAQRRSGFHLAQGGQQPGDFLLGVVVAERNLDTVAQTLGYQNVATVVIRGRMDLSQTSSLTYQIDRSSGTRQEQTVTISFRGVHFPKPRSEISNAW